MIEAVTVGVVAVVSYVLQHGQSAPGSQHGYLVTTPLAAPQRGSCGSSGRAWRLRAARNSHSEARPLDTKPLPLGCSSQPHHSLKSSISISLALTVQEVT